MVPSLPVEGALLRLRAKIGEAEPPAELLAGWCRSRHQPQAGSVHAVSRNRLTSRPASGNSCRPGCGMTELPPETDSHASA